MKIFYHKHGRGSRIAFAETMCLPEIAAKLCQMPYNIVDVHTIVVELFTPCCMSKAKFALIVAKLE